MDLIKVGVDVDAISQGGMLLKRINADSNKLTEVTVVSNRREIPQSTGTARYETIPLDQFIGENVKGWDGHSPLALYFNPEGQFDHWEKTGIATAGASAA